MEIEIYDGDIAPDVISGLKRHAEIQEEQRKLKEEDAIICNWLDKTLHIVGDDKQTYNIRGLIVKCEGTVNRTVNQEEVEKIMNNNLEAQNYADTFTYKIGLSESKWKAMSDEAKKIFATAVTEKTGKTTYKIMEEKV